MVFFTFPLLSVEILRFGAYICMRKKNPVPSKTITERNHMRFGYPPFTRRFTDDEICKICDVSPATVYRWRADPLKIPRAAKQLLDLIGAGRIIPEGWHGCYFDGDKLRTTLRHSFTRAEIEQYQWFMDYLRSTKNWNKDLLEYIDYLEQVTPRAQVIKLDISKGRPSLTEGKEFNSLFNKKRER